MNKYKWHPILLSGLILLLGSLVIGCGQPSWCNEKLTSFLNAEYGYRLYFPPTALVLIHSNSVVVTIDDDVSHIVVAIDDSWLDPCKRAESFMEKVEARNERGEEQDIDYPMHTLNYPQQWNYEIELDSRRDDFAEIRYTCLKKYIVERGPLKTKTIPITGDILWYKGEWQGEEYIYEFQYETYSDCDKCKWLLDISAQEFLSSAMHDKE